MQYFKILALLTSGTSVPLLLLFVQSPFQTCDTLKPSCSICLCCFALTSWVPLDRADDCEDPWCAACEDVPTMCIPPLSSSPGCTPWILHNLIIYSIYICHIQRYVHLLMIPLTMGKQKAAVFSDLVWAHAIKWSLLKLNAIPCSRKPTKFSGEKLAVADASSWKLYSLHEDEYLSYKPNNSSGRILSPLEREGGGLLEGDPNSTTAPLDWGFPKGSC